MTDSDDREVSAETLATWLEVRPRQIREWGVAGVAVRSARGRYLLRSSVAGVVRHLREAAAGRGSGSLDLAQERAALARAQRETADLRNAERRRELVPAGEPEREMIALSTQVSGALQGVASSIAPEAYAAPTIGECEGVIGDAIRDALRDLAGRALRDVARIEAAMQEEIQNDESK